METNLLQTARSEYSRALKMGQKEFSASLGRGERGTLKALDELTNQSKAVAYMHQSQREISMSRIKGTYTVARAHSFSANFYPLHPENSEFAGKWIQLCATHLGEGLRDAVQVYEYLWHYYVVEGNKRVSILKYYGAPTIRADITRVVPQLDENDPDTAAYYAYLQYDKAGRFKNIQLSDSSKYETLIKLEEQLTLSLENQEEVNYNTMFLQFEAAYVRTKRLLPLGDAFLEYLKVYGFVMDTTISQVVERIETLQPQMELAGSTPVEPTLLLNPALTPTPGIITRLFGQRKTARVVFAYEEGRTEDNWIGAHEKGRLQMQHEFADQVKSAFIDGMTPENADQKLNEMALDADLILITASSLSLPSLRFALENPACLMLVYSRVREDFRISTYYGRYYEAVFLCGAAAGMATRTGRIAYVTPHLDYKRHTSDVNAFALGVHSIRPDAQTFLVWRDVLPGDLSSCARGLQTAAELGSDVAYAPRFPGMPVLDMPENVFSFVGRLDARGVRHEFLAAPQWDWGRYYTEIVRSYLNGSLDILRIIDQGDPTVTGLWWGIGAGVLRFLVSDTLSPVSANLLRFLRGSISQGSFNPFHGPIYDSKNALRVEPGSDSRPYDILNMDWLCDWVKVIE